MNNNNKNFILNLFGSDVDFSAIATDNVPELDIAADIWEEKLSFLILWKDPENCPITTIELVRVHAVNVGTLLIIIRNILSRIAEMGTTGLNLWNHAKRRKILIINMRNIPFGRM